MVEKKQTRSRKNAADVSPHLTGSMDGRIPAGASRQDAEEQFRKLIQHSSDIAVILNPDGTERYVSDSLERITGFSPEECTGRNGFEFLHPDDIPAVQETLAKVLSHPNEIHKAVYRHRTKSGGWVTLEAVGSNQLHDPTINGIILNIRDVTERKRIEQALYLMSETQRQIARLDKLEDIYQLAGQKIQQLIGDGYVAASTLDETTQTVKLAGVYGFGQIYEILIKKFKWDPTKMVYPLKDMTEADLQQYRTGKLEKYEGGLYGLFVRQVPRPACTAAEKYLKLTSIFVIGLTWHGLHFGGISILAKKDITPHREMIETIMAQASIAVNRIQAEQALRANEEHYRMLAENMSDIVWLSDMSLSTIYISPSLTRLRGFTLEEMKALPPERLTTPNSLVRAMQALAEHTAPERVSQADHPTILSLELEYYKKDGSTFWCENTFTLIRDENGIPTHILGTGRDITERKRAEDALMESRERLRLALDAARMGTWDYNTAADRFLWDPQTYELFGLTPETFNHTFRAFLRCIHPADRPILRDKVRGAQKKVDSYHAEVRVLLPDKSERWLAMEGQSYQDVPGTALQLRGVVFDITERKRTQEKLRTLSLSVEQSPASVVITDPTGKIEYINPKFTHLTGYTLEEAAGQNPRILKSGETRPEEYEQLWETIKSGSEWRGIFHNKKKNGELYWESAVISPILDAKGSITQFLAVKEDITERKQAEEALQTSEARFRSLYENSRIGMYRTTPDGRILMANPALVNMLGYASFEELEKRNLEVENDADYQRAKFRNRIELEGSVLGLESTWKRKDGTHIFVRESATLGRDAEGKIAYYEGTVEDITEQKQAEEALRASKEKYKGIFDESVAAIYIFDANKHFIDSNQAGLDLLGYSRAELIQMSIPDVDADPAAVLPAHEKLLSGGRLLNYEHRLRRKDNTVITVLNNSRPITAGNGKVVGMISTLLDITERKRNEKRVQLQLRRITALSEIDRAISSSFDIRLSLEVLLNEAVAQLNIDAADILMLNPVTHTLVFFTGKGFHTQAIQQTKQTLGEGWAGKVGYERKTIHVPDLAAEEHRFTRAVLLKQEGFVEYVGVPLLSRGALKGILEVFHRSHLEIEPAWMNFLETLGQQAAIAIDNAQSFNELQQSNLEMAASYDATIAGWSQAIDLHDRKTAGETQRVVELVLQLAEKMGVNEREQVHIRRGALLHDIGEISIPDAIRLKPDKLSEEEMGIVRKHPRLAYEILASIPFLQPALDIPYCHHERWDGSGYPRNLKGEEIPFAARLFAVADVYDALLSPRPYRPAWTKEKTIQYIREQAGTYFDPAVVETFLNIIR